MNDLIPCPFCGSMRLNIGRNLDYKALDRDGGIPTFVYCADCKARGPMIYVVDNRNLTWTSTRMACEKTGWNRRHIECALKEETKANE